MKEIRNKVCFNLVVVLTIIMGGCEKLPPVASFFINDNIYNAGDTVYFHNTSLNGTTVSWDFGDGAISQETNPYHIYTAKGEYTIRLMVSNTDGSDEATRTLEILPRLLWQKHVIDDMDTASLMVDTADLDADGDLDLVVTYPAIPAFPAIHRLIWYENNYPDWIPHLIDERNDRVLFFGFADVDGNGTLDVIASLYDLSQLVWYENPSWDRHDIDLKADNPYFIIVADINKDNKPDAVTAGTININKPGVVIWYENQYPNWIPHVIDGARGNYPGIAVIDIDGDGLLDVAGSMALDNKVVWYRNEGNGTTWVKHYIDENIINPFGLNTADVNADGAPDILVGNGGPFDPGSELYLYENHYPNWTKITIDTDLSGALWTEVIDVNNDGLRDIVADGFFAGIVWYENQQTTWKKHTVDNKSNGPRLFITMDVDGDSYIDIVSPSLDKLVWYKHPGVSVASD